MSDYAAPTPGQLDIFGREVSIEEARQISAALPIDHDRYEHTTALHDAGPLVAPGGHVGAHRSRLLRGSEGGGKP